jgi:hypothetical protein
MAHILVKNVIDYLTVSVGDIVFLLLNCFYLSSAHMQALCHHKKWDSTIVNKGLTPASCIFSFLFLAFRSKDRIDIWIYGHW